MKNILLFILLLFGITVKAGIIRTVIVGSGYSYNMDIYIPDGAIGKLPTIIFIPGNGEVGTNPDLLYVHGPLRFIRDNNFRPNMIIAGVQPTAEWPNYAFVNRVILAILANPDYHANSEKLYLTGLSGGAGGIYSYMRQPNDLPIVPAALAPMSLTISCSCGDFYEGTDYLCNTDLRWKNIPAWGFCRRGDSHWEKMNRFWIRMNESNWLFKPFTTEPGGHDNWNAWYNPNYVGAEGYTLYQWFLRFPLIGLPVKFGDFYFDDRNSQLVWTTESEIDNDHFEIEESEDARNWSTIGIVKTNSTNGNSVSTLKYTFKL